MKVCQTGSSFAAAEESRSESGPHLNEPESELWP
jgi:hypothetical protein